MLDLFKIYHYLIIILWFIFSGPLFLVYKFFCFISFYYQKMYFKNNLFPNRLILFFWNLEKIIVNDVYIHFPEQLIDWLIPNQTKKTKEEIMKAINPSKVHDYVCKSERGLSSSEQTVFKVKYLTVNQTAELRDEIYTVKGVGKARSEKLQTGTVDMKTLKLGLVGWANFKDEEGKEVVFDKNKIIDMLDMIPPEARTELAGHIRGESELTEGEE